jgi:hypothetical protein
MQGPPPGPHGYPADMRPPPKEHFMGMLPGANMPNGKALIKFDITYSNPNTDSLL